MNTTYFNQSVTPIPMNCVDRYMYGMENEDLHMNLHLVLDLDAPIEVTRLQKTVSRLFEDLPLCRSFIVEKGFKYLRYAAEKPWFDPLKYIEIREKADPTIEDRYIHQAFDLRNGPPVRFLYIPTGDGKWRLYFSANHSAFDGNALALLCQEFFEVWSGRPVSSELRETRPFRFRELFFRKGYFWFIKQALIVIRPFGRTKRPVTATLLESSADPRREVSSRTIDFDAADLMKLRMTMKARIGSAHVKLAEYMGFCAFRVLNRMIASFGETEKPITILFPMNQRSHFRFRKIFQNVVGLIYLSFPRSEIPAKGFFDSLQKQLIEKGRFEESSKVAFFLGFFSTILKPAKLRAVLKKSDQDPACVFNTLLINIGRLPRNFRFPPEFAVHRLYGRSSAIPKMPGVTMNMIGTGEKQTLSIEWLRHQVSEARIAQFEKELLAEIWSERADA